MYRVESCTCILANVSSNVETQRKRHGVMRWMSEREEGSQLNVNETLTRYLCEHLGRFSSVTAAV